MLDRLRKYLPCRHHWIPVVVTHEDDAGNLTTVHKFRVCLKCDRRRLPEGD